MIREKEVIARLRRIATAPEARGLLDDVALIDGLVITHDAIAEGVHFLSSDPPASVGWKLVAVNLSDLAAKGAVPVGALLSLTLSGNDEWDSGFLAGLEEACERYKLPLIGGDTIALPAGTPRVLGMTALGRAADHVPSRSGGKSGDRLWLVGTMGDSAAGLAQLKNDPTATGPLVESYRRPVPHLDAGQALAPDAHAMMDISDGLLLDTLRLAEASGCTAVIDLDLLPLSQAFLEECGGDFEARVFAGTAGDDYALLAALPPELEPSTLSLPQATRLTCVGALAAGPASLSLRWNGQTVALPERLGFEHQGHDHRELSGSPVGDRT